MAKDRARPFSRKHRKYWLTVTGGMLLIGALDLLLGWMFWPHRGDEDGPPQQIRYDVQHVPYAPMATLDDARLADAPAPPPTATTR